LNYIISINLIGFLLITFGAIFPDIPQYFKLKKIKVFFHNIFGILLIMSISIILIIINFKVLYFVGGLISHYLMDYKRKNKW